MTSALLENRASPGLSRAEVAGFEPNPRFHGLDELRAAARPLGRDRF